MSSQASILDRNRDVWSRDFAAFSYRRASGLFPAEIAIFERLGSELARSRLLDIGIGTGRTTGALLNRVASYAGCDYSSSMVKRAQSRFPMAELCQADARELVQFPDQTFDVVLFSFNGIDNADHEDRLRILAEMRRVLRPGGAMIMSSHNRDYTVPKAWHPANLGLRWNPKSLVRGPVLYCVGIWNHLRMRRHERQDRDYAIVNDGEQYALLQYHIRAADQVRQLERAGYTGIELYGLDGQRTEPDKAAPRDFMVHYLARRA